MAVSPYLFQSAPTVSLNPALDAYVGVQFAMLLNRGDVTELYVNDDGYVWYES